MGSIVYNGVLLSAGMGGVAFLPSSWYSAVLWVQDGNNVGYTLILGLLLSSADPKSRIFSLPCSGSEQVHKRLGGSTARPANLNVPRGYSIHGASHGQCINWGGWSGAAECLSGTGWALVRVW